MYIRLCVYWRVELTNFSLEGEKAICFYRPVDAVFININNMINTAGVANSSNRFYWWTTQAKHSFHARCLKITLLPVTP